MRGILLLRVVAVSFILSLISLGFAKLNFLGLESSSDQRSDQIVQKLMAPFYPGVIRNLKKNVLSTDNISIIYFDDSHYKSHGFQNRPPNYRDFAQVLHNVTTRSFEDKTAKPRAVFFDFYMPGYKFNPSELKDTDCEEMDKRGNFNPNYEDTKCENWVFLNKLAETTKYEEWKGLSSLNDTPLQRIARIIKSGGIPVLIGHPGDGLLEETPFLAEIKRRALLVNIRVNIFEYPMIKLFNGAKKKEGIKSSEYVDNISRSSGAMGGYSLSAAPALYAAYCLSQEDKCGIPEFENALSSSNTSPEGFSKELKSPISVVWGMGPHKFQEKINAGAKLISSCQFKNNSDIISFSNFIGYAERTAQILFDRTPNFDCKPFLSIPYNGIPSLFGSDLQIENEVRSIFDSKLIIIGEINEASTDWVRTPLGQNVPGLYLHAMALANLLDFGVEYRKTSHYFETDDIIEFALSWTLFVLAFHTNFLLTKSNYRYGSMKRIKIYFSHILGTIAASMLIVSLCIFILREEPINWLGVISLTFTYMIFENRNNIRKDLRALLYRDQRSTGIISFFNPINKFFEIEDEMKRGLKKKRAPSNPKDSGDNLLNK